MQFEPILSDLNQIINLIHLYLFWSNLNQYSPTFTKGGHKERVVYCVRERRFISTWCKHPILSDFNFQKWVNKTTWQMTRSLIKIALNSKIIFRNHKQINWELYQNAAEKNIAFTLAWNYISVFTLVMCTLLCYATTYLYAPA